MQHYAEAMSSQTTNLVNIKHLNINLKHIYLSLISGVQQIFYYWAWYKSVEQYATNCQFHISVFISTNDM